MCGWFTLLCSRKLTEHCKPAIMEKIKIIIKRNTGYVSCIVQYILPLTLRFQNKKIAFLVEDWCVYLCFRLLAM